MTGISDINEDIFPLASFAPGGLDGGHWRPKQLKSDSKQGAKSGGLGAAILNLSRFWRHTATAEAKALKWRGDVFCESSGFLVFKNSTQVNSQPAGRRSCGQCASSRWRTSQTSVLLMAVAVALENWKLVSWKTTHAGFIFLREPKLNFTMTCAFLQCPEMIFRVLWSFL